MTLYIEPDVKFPQGDMRRIQFQILDDEEEPIDTTGYEFEWVLEDTRTRNEVISLESSSGVKIDARDDYIGKLDILLETSATSELDSTDYREVFRATDPDGNQTTWVGEIILTEGL